MPEEIFPDDYYKYDVTKFKRFLDRFPEDIRSAYSQEVRNTVSGIKKNKGMRVIMCGMGGSAIAGDIIKSYLDSEDVLIETVRDYSIPGKLTKDDFVILTSYSGNTEETLSCYRQVRREGAQLVVMTSGGKLEEAIISGRIPFIKLPKDIPPRAALPYMFFTLLRILEETALISPRNDDVNQLLEHLHRQSLSDFAIELSEKIYGKIPIIYASNKFYSIAYRWKTQVNENAKSVAFSNAFSELNHNEITGFETKNGLYHVIVISMDEDNARMKKRMTLSKEILQEKGINVTELNVKGNRLVKIFNAVLAGDLTSYYLALRYRTDPTPVTTIEMLKRKMGPFI